MKAFVAFSLLFVSSLHLILAFAPLCDNNFWADPKTVTTNRRHHRHPASSTPSSSTDDDHASTGSSLIASSSTATTTTMTTTTSPKSGLPLPYGGDMIPRKTKKNKDSNHQTLPEMVRDFVLNFEIPPEISNFQFRESVQTLEMILQENVLRTPPDGQSRGEIYVAIQFGLVLCIFLGDANLPMMLGNMLSWLLGPALLVSGIVVMILTALNLGPALSPWPVPNGNTKELQTTGLYGLVRHPMYAGLLATSLGFSVWTDSALRVLFTIALLYALNLKTLYEEEALLQKFGAEYANYQQEVPDKLLPGQNKLLLALLPEWKEHHHHDDDDKDVTMF